MYKRQAQQDAAFRPSHTPATPWPALAQALAEAGIAAHVHGAAPADGVTGVSLDSRVVRPGDLYVAVPGAHAHGAAFAATALEAGAVGVLTDAAGRALLAEQGLADVPVLEVDAVRTAAGTVAARVYGGGGDAGPRLLGVTGTNGKTTTSFLAAALLEALGLSLIHI